MAAYARPAVMASVGSTVHIGAYISHTMLFIQLRQRASALSQRDGNNEDLDVRWVSGWAWLKGYDHTLFCIVELGGRYSCIG